MADPVWEGVPERFQSRLVLGEQGCWFYQGAKNRKGYGNVRWDGRTRLLHRVVWERVHGPVPSGLVLHHVCRQRACCNPAHLQPVPNAENRLLDRHPLCQKGLHQMSEENRTREGRCRECLKVRRRSYWAVHQDEINARRRPLRRKVRIA